VRPTRSVSATLALPAAVAAFALVALMGGQGWADAAPPQPTTPQATVSLQPARGAGRSAAGVATLAARAQPAPTTTTTTTTTTAAGGGGQGGPPTGPGRLLPLLPLPNIPSLVEQAINQLLVTLLSSALNPTLDLLGRTLLATPDVTASGSRIRELWWASAGIANSGFVLLVLLGGILVMTHESLQARYSAKQILPRLAVAFIAANTSLVLAGWAIRLANAVSRAVLGKGVDPQRVAQTLSPLRLLPGPGARNLFLTLLGLVVAALALGLLVTCVLRAALVAILVAGAPLALALHALPHTEGLARLWWRALAAALGVQVGQALVLVVALRVFFDADRAQVLGIGTGRLADLLVSGALLWLLLRIPGWARRAVFGPRAGGLGRIVRGYAFYLLAGRFLRRVPRR
jgi:hypothetical protein